MENKKLNVLHVSQQYPCGTDFYGIFVKHTIDALSKKINCTLISPKPLVLPFKFFPYHKFFYIPPKEKTKKYTIHYPRYLYPIPDRGILKRMFYHLVGFFYRLSVIPYIKKNIKKPDIIHAHFAYPDAFAMLPIKKYWGVPMVIHLRGILMEKIVFEWPRTAAKIKQAFRDSELIIANNHELKERFLKL